MRRPDITHSRGVKHVHAAVRRLRRTLVTLSLLLVAATGYATHTHRQLRALRERDREIARRLSTAEEVIRRRDSALVSVRERVDTAYVPVLWWVAVHDTAGVPRSDSAPPRAGTQLAHVSDDLPSGGDDPPPIRACAVSATTQPERAANDSVLPPRDVPLHLARDGLLTPRRPRVLSAKAAYFGVLATADLGNAWLHIDRDPGGYLDVWNTQDKLAHGAMGAVLSMTAIEAGVRAPWAVAITCAGAAGFEWSQGYASRKDFIAGCAGAAVGAGIHWGAEKLVGRR